MKPWNSTAGTTSYASNNSPRMAFKHQRRRKKSQIDHMKEMCFLISAYQKRYSFLLKHLRYRDNVGRDEYPVTTTLVLDLLIRVEFGIHGNQKSTYDHCVSKGSRQKNGRMRHTFVQQRQGFTQGGHEKNTTLIPGRDRTTLNAICYNCQKPGQLAYNFIRQVALVHAPFRSSIVLHKRKFKTFSQLTTIGCYWIHVHQQVC